MFHLNKKLLPILFFSVMISSCIFLQSAIAAGNIGKISDSSFYDSNTLYVVGEVINTGNVAVQNTNVKVIFYDSSNQKITSVEGHTDLNVIRPQAKSFFNIRMLESEGSLNVSTYTIWFNWTDTEAGKPPGLVILTKSNNTDSEGHLHVTGQIQNQGTVNSNNTEVSATFYNSSGTVVGTAWAFANPSNLAPNQIANFDIELIYTQQVAKVYSFGLTAESNTLAYSSTPLTSPSPSPTASASASSTPQTSSSPSPSPALTISPNPSATPQNTLSNSPSPNPSSTPETTPTSTSPQSSNFTPSPTAQTTNSPLESQSPNPISATSTDFLTTVIAVIATIVIILLAIAFIFYWTKKRKLPRKL